MSQENRNASPIKKYYIAYFDLLGYKQFFKNHPDKVEDFLKDIHDVINNTKTYIHRVNSSPIGGGLGQLSIQAKIFSDNILLCLEAGITMIEYPRFLAFLSIVADIQRNFILQYGLFLRGGITISTLSFNEDFIFGQGMIDAVALEEHAVYPRIIMDQSVLDYVLQPHFVKQADLDRACEIERRAHAGEQISDDDLAFCNSIIPATNIEKFYLQWRDHLFFLSNDGVVVLNYLYYLDIKAMIGQDTMDQLSRFVKAFSPNDHQILSDFSPDQKQRLVQHKVHIIQKINEFGTYDDLDISESQDASIREHILKKYLWVLFFHNYICKTYHLPECMIQSGSTCDIRFMQMTAEILEDTPQTIKLPNGE